MSFYELKKTKICDSFKTEPSFLYRKYGNIIKLLIIILSISYSHKLYIERLVDIESLKQLIIYVAMFLTCVSTLFFISFIKNNSIRILWSVIIFLASILVESYRSIMGDFLHYSGFITLYESNGFAEEALRQYAFVLVEPAIISCLLFVGVAMPPSRPWRMFAADRLLRGFFFAWPYAVIISLVLVCYARGGGGLIGLPSGIATLPYSSLLAFELFTNDVIGERQTIAQTGQKLVSKGDLDIILIIDESIRGDYLDINSAAGVRTNLLDKAFAHNFGLSVAATNCSAPTNLILRFGGTRGSYQSYISTKPSLWAFAKNADFKTVYIDGQRTGGRLQNGMDQAEVDLIDEFIQLEDTAIVERDIAIAEIIAKRTQNEQLELIVVNKVGAHFPVHDKYPDSHMLYQPALPRGMFANITDTGDRSEFGEWAEFINSYKNTLLWTVGHFFEIFAGIADLKRSIVIYTPDHGQDFHEDGSTSLGLHCSSRPNPFEGVVTTVVLTEHERWMAPFSTWSKTNFDQTSHYNIFPTLLLLLGYEKTQINDIYGDTLVEPVEDPLTFNSEFYARFGRKAHWVEIRPEDIRSQTMP